MENAFEEAIRNEEFVVYLQPKYSVETEEIVGAEALVRWLHEQKGWISPGQFIPALEKGGYISQLDRYMIEKVTGCLNQRRTEGKTVCTRIRQSFLDGLLR